MEPLAAAWDRVASRVAAAPAIALGLDFDGTLAPIRPRPEESALPPSARDALLRLVALPDVTVVVASGRALADLEARLDLPGVIRIGSHGFERHLPDGPVRLVCGSADLGAVRSALRVLQRAVSGLSGVWLEDKGVTAAIHFRGALPEIATRLRETVRSVAATLPAGVRVDEGRCVFDLRPADPAGGKWAALRDVLGEAGVPEDALRIYFGDDTTDEEVFAGLGGDAVTVRVGDAGESSRARYAAADPVEVAFLLGALAREASARSRRGA